MSDEHKPPTTQAEAFKMITPLDPAMPKGAFSAEEKDIAFFRLVEFIRLLLPES